MKDWLLHARESLLVFLTRKHKWEVCWKRTGASYCTSSRACDHCTDLFGKKKDFAVWISILAVQMSLKSFWQIQFPLLRIEAMPLFFFPPLVLLSKLIRLNPGGGIPGTPTFNCPTRLTHKEWKWALGAASDDEELWKGDEDGHSKFL